MASGVFTDGYMQALLELAADGTAASLEFVEAKWGEGGHVGGVPNVPDPTRTQLESEATPQPPGGAEYTFTKALVAGSVVNNGDGTATATLTLDALEANDRGDGSNPTFYEFGIFDGDGRLCIYGTMDGIVKNNTRTVSLTFTLTYYS